jgi:acetyl-CoA/propionyl-CoA carboxylase biotin carboxyl carrier protein
MGEAAVKVALKCGYVGAGTVEMLYQDGEFYFLEMNTRLQVEHCVTEAVTGLDLVAWQLSVAEGHPLALEQADVRCNGHAIELRINAEDPARNFLPSPGTITRLRVPSGPGVRWDGGYLEGDTISQYYDNLVGKLVVWAPDRAGAIARMQRALGEFEIAGIRTTIPAHRALIGHADFAAVRHSTKWVEDEVDHALFTPDATDTATAPSSSAGAADQAGAPLAERTLPVEVNGKRFTVRVWVPEQLSAPANSAGAGNARSKPRAGRVAGSSSGGSGTVSAPMQGTIVKVLVSEGDRVEIGQTMLVLEAMKMENNIAAERAGTVKDVRVEAGQSVGTGDVLVTIE